MTDVLLEGAADEITRLKADNAELRKGLMQIVQEKLVLEEQLAGMSAECIRLRRELHPTHDWEPCRPGLEDVD